MYWKKISLVDLRPVDETNTSLQIFAYLGIQVTISVVDQAFVDIQKQVYIFFYLWWYIIFYGAYFQNTIMTKTGDSPEWSFTESHAEKHR